MDLKSEELQAVDIDEKVEQRVLEQELDDSQRAEERRTMRKVDWRLVPALGVLYSIAGLDRVNLSNARAAGMNKDLGFNVGNRYSIALLVFFITYFLFELPTVLAMRRVGPRNLLNGLAVSWGAVMLGMGWANDWRVIVVCRMLIGVFEAGFLPCCMYLLSCWYQRYEVQRRMAFWYIINLTVSAFGNILAYAIIKLYTPPNLLVEYHTLTAPSNGTHGIAGWRWIFIIEGALTIGAATLGYFAVLGFPDIMLGTGKRQGFTARELELVLDRVERDRGDSKADKLTTAKVLRHMVQWPLWVYGFMFLTSSVPIYAFAYFIQTILSTMGYNTAMVFLLCAPPYLLSGIWTVAVAWMADKSRLRMPFMALNAAITLTGLLVTAYHKNNGVRYFGVFFGVCGCNANLPTIIAFQANNVISNSRRSVANGVQMFFAAIGGIYASTVFMQKEYPFYRTGVWCTVATQFLLLLLCVLMTWFFRRENKKASETDYQIQEDRAFRYTF